MVRAHLHGYVVNGIQEFDITLTSMRRKWSFSIMLVLHARDGAAVNRALVRDAWLELRRQWRQKK